MKVIASKKSIKKLGVLGIASLLLILTVHQVQSKMLAKDFVEIPKMTSVKVCDEPEKNCSVVDVNRFSVSRYEVTISDWNDCVNQGYCKQQGDETLPADAPIQVSSLKSVFSFLEWKNKGGTNFRLPTLQEYAAMMAHDGIFWFDSSDCDRDVWGRSLCNVSEVKSVGYGLPNYFGVYNLHGNAAEWIWPTDYEDCSLEKNRFLSLSFGSTRHSGLETVGVECNSLRPIVGFRLVKPDA